MDKVLAGFIESCIVSGILYTEAVREFKKRYITRVLVMNGGNQCKAARELHMHRNTLSRTIGELKINMPEVLDEVRKGKRKAVQSAPVDVKRTIAI